MASAVVPIAGSPFWTFRTPAFRSYKVRLLTWSLILLRSMFDFYVSGSGKQEGSAVEVIWRAFFLFSILR